jgi:hypothetical protein
LADAVDVGGFTDHQTAMIDVRLHPTDIVAHDEEDVGLLLLCGCWHVRGHHGSDGCKQAEAFNVSDVHSCSPPLLVGCYAAETD